MRPKKSFLPTSNLLLNWWNYRGTHRLYTPFIILTAPRSGSTWLQDLLHSHPEIHCHQELLDRLKVQLPLLQRRPWWQSKVSRLEVLYRNHFPEDFLKRFVLCGYHPHIKAVGFKAMYAHLLLVDYGVRCRRVLQALPTLKILHLERKNSLASFVSFAVAQQTGRWEVVRHQVQVHLEPQELLSRFEKRNKMLATLRKRFSDKSWLDVSYEQLSRDPRGECARIQQFLGVEVRPLHSRLIKQEIRPLKKIISNYGDVAAALRGTTYEHCLDEA